MMRVRPSRWPLAVRAPLIVAVLMIACAAAISNVVLNRLARVQAHHFAQLSGAYLDGLSTALHSYVIRRDPWEAFDVLDRARAKYSGVEARVVLVVLPDETVLAALDPSLYPLGSRAPRDAVFADAHPDLTAADGRVWIHRLLREGNEPIGRIAALIDIGALQEVRAQTFRALVAVNGALTLLFAAVGWFLVHRTLLPLTRLSAYLARASDGRLEPMPAHAMPPPDTEAGMAYRRYNAAATAAMECEALLHRLAEEERRALIGRFASAIAHEVNNPLGGLFNAVRMIQRHGDDPERRARAANLIERGLVGIRQIVKSSLAVWRGEDERRRLSHADVEDLRFLAESEARRNALVLDWRNGIDAEVDVAAQPFRQIALNLILNACAASPSGGLVCVSVEIADDATILSVSDQGPGLPLDARQVLLSAAPSAAMPHAGLGLWLVSRLVQDLGGAIGFAGPPGTRLSVRIPHAQRLAGRAA